jgi:hypothetical protein
MPMGHAVQFPRIQLRCGLVDLYWMDPDRWDWTRSTVVSPSSPPSTAIAKGAWKCWKIGYLADLAMVIWSSGCDSDLRFTVLSVDFFCDG